MYTFTLENVCTPSAPHAWTIDPIATYIQQGASICSSEILYRRGKVHCMCSNIHRYTGEHSVGCRDLYVIPMVSFYGILAQLTFACAAARHLATYIAMCAVNWWNSLHKQTQTQTDTHTHTYTYTYMYYNHFLCNLYCT